MSHDIEGMDATTKDVKIVSEENLENVLVRERTLKKMYKQIVSSFM